MSLPLDHIVMDLKAGSMTEAVRRLVDAAPGVAADNSPALVRELLEVAYELAPGLVLVHAESAFTKAHAVVIGIAKEGVETTSGDMAHVVVLLLDPPGRDVARHLENLATVARIFRSPSMVDRAKAAANSDELRELLENLQRPTLPRTEAAGAA